MKLTKDKLHYEQSEMQQKIKWILWYYEKSKTSNIWILDFSFNHDSKL